MKTKTTIWSRNFFCIFLVNGLFTLSQWPVNPLVSQYAQYLGAGDIMMGLLTGLFFGVSLALHPAAGAIMTKYDSKSLLLVVFIFGVVSNLGYALFPTLGAFFAFRVLHGVLYCFAGMLCLIIAGNSLPPEKMGSGMAIYGVSSAVMCAVGPSIGIWLRDYGRSVRDVGLGYKFCFLFAALVLIVTLIPTAMIKPEKKTEMSNTPKEPWYKTIITAKALPAALVMVLVIMNHSILNSYMVNYADELGVSGINLFFTVMALAMLATRPIAGKLTDKLGCDKIIIPSLIVFAASFVIIGTARSLPMLVVGAVFAAIGYGSSQPALLSICLSCVPQRKRAVASNTLFIGIDMGYFLGPLVGSIVFSMTSYATMYLLFTIMVGIALVLFVLLWPTVVKNQREALLCDGKSRDPDSAA